MERKDPKLLGIGEGQGQTEDEMWRRGKKETLIFFFKRRKRKLKVRRQTLKGFGSLKNKI